MTPALRPLSDAERVDWLRLSRSEGIGPQTFIGLIQRFGTAAAALDALPRLARHRRGIVAASREQAEKEIEVAHRRNWQVIGLNEPAYPPALRVIDTAPPLIMVRGQVPVLQRSMVALVGSRNASGSGLIFTERLATGIGSGGYVVVSGLARGIDVRAHRATLVTGTVAVLAGGLDKIYPGEHAELAGTIAEAGAVISEMPLGWEPRGRDFPRRNRIVSGLALATVVVEAAHRSGSLITARLANEQGREVFAVPGSPLDPRAEGTNELLRHGATLCTGAADVLDVLGSMSGLRDCPGRLTLPRLDTDADQDSEGDDPIFASDPVTDDEPAAVRRLLGPAPIAFDELVRLSALSAGHLRAVLLELELSGEARTEGGFVTGRPS